MRTVEDSLWYAPNCTLIQKNAQRFWFIQAVLWPWPREPSMPFSWAPATWSMLIKADWCASDQIPVIDLPKTKLCIATLADAPFVAAVWLCLLPLDLPYWIVGWTCEWAAGFVGGRETVSLLDRSSLGWFMLGLSKRIISDDELSKSSSDDTSE